MEWVVIVGIVIGILIIVAIALNSRKEPEPVRKPIKRIKDNNDEVIYTLYQTNIGYELISKREEGLAPVHFKSLDDLIKYMEQERINWNL